MAKVGISIIVSWAPNIISKCLLSPKELDSFQILSQLSYVLMFCEVDADSKLVGSQASWFPNRGTWLPDNSWLVNRATGILRAISHWPTSITWHVPESLNKGAQCRLIIFRSSAGRDVFGQHVNFVFWPATPCPDHYRLYYISEIPDTCPSIKRSKFKPNFPCILQSGRLLEPW